MIRCSACSAAYPDQGLPYCCPVCRGVFDFCEVLGYSPDLVKRDLPGIWRYRHAFGLPEVAPIVTLGEGSTALVWGDVDGRQIAFKCEYLNPSGSFKDRGSAVLMSILLTRGISAFVEDSSGNAGASLAAYAARAGISAEIFVPSNASGPKHRQMMAYGAKVRRVDGPRANAAEAVRAAAELGAIYASHAYLPFHLLGYATLAYELVEQLGQAPGTVVLPVGQGGLLLGLALGFRAMEAAGMLQSLPVLVGVQARTCAPLWEALHRKMPRLVTSKSTVAEGIAVQEPVRGDAILSTIDDLGGVVLAVDEDDILSGRSALAKRGFFVEPTSAVVWDAINQLGNSICEPVVAILTGSGLKTDL